VVSVLLLIVFGIIEFGQFYSRYEVFTSAAREGARVASVRGTASDVVARVDEASTPYTPSATPTVSTTCDETTVGDPVTVSWPQTFSISLPLVPPIDTTVTIQGVFRCE